MIEDKSLSDQQIEIIRDHLYALADTIVGLVSPSAEASGESRDSAFIRIVTLLPEGEREMTEERAAIHEYDGMMSRDEAEKETLRNLWRIGLGSLQQEKESESPEFQ